MWPLASLLVAATLITSQVSFAAETVRLMSGGPSTLKKMTPLMPAIEKATGVELEMTVNPIGVGLLAVEKGVIDAVIGPLDETFEDASKRAGKPVNRSDFQWFTISKSELNGALHPSNPSDSLTKDQIAGILSGKIKNWKEINGKDLPIRVLMAKNYVASMKIINQFYIKSDKAPAAQEVLNKDGLINGVKSDPGAIAFFTAREKLPDFSPKFFTLEVSMESSMIAKKQMRPPAQKVYDYLKANPVK